MEEREFTNQKTELRLAAIERSDQSDVDQLLSDVALHLKQMGYRVGGAIRSNTAEQGRNRCDLVVKELITGETVSLSQDLGPGATGCTLDTAALEQVAGMVESSLQSDLDVLIVNKFGKRESEGAGLSGPIAQAVTAAIPVLASVNQEQKAAWHEFCGGEGHILKPDRAAVMQWLTDNLPPTPAIQTA